MKRNCMKEVAAMYEMELEEQFNIKSDDVLLDKGNPYQFTNEGVEDCDGNLTAFLIEGLLTGELTIERLPLTAAQMFAQLGYEVVMDSRVYFVCAKKDKNELGDERMTYISLDTQDLRTYTRGDGAADILPRGFTYAEHKAVIKWIEEQGAL